MSTLAETAPAFVDMAHRIVWATVATVGGDGAPTSRILHPLWIWDGDELVGWIATARSGVKERHLASNPMVSLSYWSPNHDTCVADCRATFFDDMPTREWLWDALKSAPPPVGYDPAMVPGWESPESDAFHALRLDPIALRVFPGTMLLKGAGEVLAWRKPRIGDPPAV
jgi:general stress protein 26